MKKNLLILGSLVFTLQAVSAQVLTYVGDNALLTVKDGALVYSGGGWQNAAAGNVSNEGDIMIVGNNTNDIFALTTGSDFRLEFLDPLTYGQLYITGVPQTRISGKVSKEFQADSNHSDQLGTLGRQQTALPFVDFTIQDLKNVLEPGNATAAWLNTTNTTLNYTGRFNVSSVFKWNNGKARYDQIANANTATVVGKPTDYYILPRRSQNANATVFQMEWDAAEDLKTFRGIPSSDEDANVKVSITGAANGIDFGYNGNNKNYYYERYNTYIVDPFRVGGGRTGTPTWEADYGKNLYEFANPFLTNIDLKYIAFNEGATGDGIALNGVYGIAVFGAGSINWQNGVGSTYNTSHISYGTFSGGVLQGGDTHTVIKPMGEFYLKMDKDAVSPAVEFAMQNTRRFAQTSRTSTTYGGVTGKTANIPADKVVKQVAVILKDVAGAELGRTYYAVTPSVQTGASNDELQAYVLQYPIYTKEEISTGGEDTNEQGMLYINAANEVDFAKKEIPLRIDAQNGSSLSFELYEAGERAENGVLSTGKSFYIKINDEVTQITDGGSVALVNNANYGLYYDAPEALLSSSDASLSQTVIAKKDTEWVIRYAKSWKSADVEIYSAAGQLIHSKKNVTTSTDYVLPLNSEVSGLFIVRTVSEKGEVVTKKIVK